jgi:glycosyltransferase involved in cell wall biosynthesis
MLSLIIPLYRNEGSIPDLLEAVDVVRAGVPDGLEAVFVVDGSPDRCYELLLKSLPARAYPSRLALLSRNFGSFSAIRAGLELGSGQRYAVMAADLQEPPELVIRMDAELRAGDVDVVLGVREGRSDPRATRWPADIYWALYRRLVITDIPPRGVDVFACNRVFRDALVRMAELHSSLIGQVFWLGFRRSFVSYARQERRHGRSAWTLRRKLEYFADSVYSFTDLPIRLLIRIGGIVALVFGIFGLIVAAARLLGVIEVPGFAALALLIVFFGSLNLFGLGIVGSYAWRGYENSKARPTHVVLREHSFEPGPSDR